VPLNLPLFFICGGAYFLLMIARANDVLATLCLAYCVVYIGMTPFTWFDRLLRVDLSYGVYLYGYPITQALVYFLSPQLEGHDAAFRRVVIMGLALPLTALFAYASWIWIEKPALSLKRFIGDGKKDKSERDKSAKPATQAQAFPAPAE